MKKIQCPNLDSFFFYVNNEDNNDYQFWIDTIFIIAKLKNYKIVAKKFNKFADLANGFDLLIIEREEKLVNKISFQYDDDKIVNWVWINRYSGSSNILKTIEEFVKLI